jgi:hypothetical protein
MNSPPDSTNWVGKSGTPKGEGEWESWKVTQSGPLHELP